MLAWSSASVDLNFESDLLISGGPALQDLIQFPGPSEELPYKLGMSEPGVDRAHMNDFIFRVISTRKFYTWKIKKLSEFQVQTLPASSLTILDEMICDKWKYLTCHTMDWMLYLNIIFYTEHFFRHVNNLLSSAVSKSNSRLKTEFCLKFPSWKKKKNLSWWEAIQFQNWGIVLLINCMNITSAF